MFAWVTLAFGDQELKNGLKGNSCKEHSDSQEDNSSQAARNRYKCLKDALALKQANHKPKVKRAHKGYSIRNQPPKHSKVKHPVDHWEHLWFCNNCGDGPHSVFTEHCPECQHRRCTDCKFERHKIYDDEYTFADICSGTTCERQTSFTTPKRARPSLPPSQPDPTTQSRPFQHATSPARLQSGTRNYCFTKPTCNSSALWIRSSWRSKDLQPETIDPGQLSGTLSSPSSTHGSSSPSEIFSDLERSGNSGTDLDDDDVQSDEESVNAEPTLELGHANTIRILESNLLYILRENLDLAARLIPEIHRRLNIEHSGDTEGYYSTPSSQNTTNPSTQGPSPRIPNDWTKAITNREPRKRGRSSEEEEEDNDDDSKRSRQNSRKIPDYFSTRGLERRPTFACPFHKFNPSKYGGRAWADRKFRTCIGPGPTELRRIKDHLKARHRSPQCIRCYAIFNSIDELLTHQQRLESCSMQPQALKEGIDDAQWAKIEHLLKAKRGLSAEDRMRHDVEKWFKIWKLLFPEVSPPDHPWNEHQPPLPTASSSLDVDFLFSTFENRIQLEIQQGTLQQDDATHQRYLHALRGAIEAATVASRDPASFAGLMSEANENTRHLQQEYSSSSMRSTEPTMNFGEQQPDTGWLDSATIVGASDSPSQVAFSISFVLSPRAQAISSPQPIPSHTGNHSMVSGDDFLLAQTSHENLYDNLDPFFDFYIDGHMPESLLPSQSGDNNMENSEAFVENNQDLFGLEGHLDDGSWAAFLEREGERAGTLETTPEIYARRQKRTNMMGKIFNDKDEE